MIRESRLPRKALWLWQIRLGGLALFPITAFFILGRISLWFHAVGLFLTVAALWVIFFYLPRYFAAFRFEQTADRLLVRRGVWFRRTDLLPHLRVVYTVSLVSPLARRWGLCALSFKLVRGWLILPEIAVAQAEKLLAEVRNES